MRLTVAARVLASACLLAFAGQASAQQPTLGNIRALADGAGPSHIFWLTGPLARSGGADVVGIVDPLYAAIRFFSIERPTGSNDNLAARWKPLGACALRVDFFPWRVHHTKTRVIIEGMPRPGAGHNSVEGAFRSAVLTMDRRIASGPLRAAIGAAGSRIETTSWNPANEPQCGDYAAAEATTGSVLRGAAWPIQAQPHDRPHQQGQCAGAVAAADGAGGHRRTVLALQRA
jgi:hypothetical protein